MAEYIEREKLISILKEKRRKLSEDSRHFFTKLVMLCKFEQLVNSTPTADVEPIKHGKWEYDGSDRHCENCGAIVEEDEWFNHNWNYCYHCGVRMEGD